MEKISGIVPSSRRVSSVDLKNSPPVRPGTPSFGRAQGISTLGEQNKPTTAQLAIAKQDELRNKRSLSEKSPAMVQDMADRFFMQKKKESEKVEDLDINMGWSPSADGATTANIDTRMAPIDMDTQISEPSVKAKSENFFAKAEAVPIEEQEFTPPGSYLDVVA